MAAVLRPTDPVCSSPRPDAARGYLCTAVPPHSAHSSEGCGIQLQTLRQVAMWDEARGGVLRASSRAAAPTVRRIWIPAFAGMSGVWGIRAEPCCALSSHVGRGLPSPLIPAKAGIHTDSPCGRREELRVGGGSALRLSVRMSRLQGPMDSRFRGNERSKNADAVGRSRAPRRVAWPYWPGDQAS